MTRVPAGLEDCVPRDKHDADAVRRARALGFPTIDPILPDLLEWVQDINWPVAPLVVDLLEEAGPAIAPHILAILRSDDDVWKYHVIERCAPSWSPEIWVTVAEDVTRLRDRPSPSERAEEVDIVAREALAARPAPPE